MPPIPEPWSSFYVDRDDDVDAASALCCVVSAGIHLGTLVRDDQVGLRVMERLDLAVGHTDMTEKAVRALAQAADLDLWRPNEKGKGLDMLAYRAEECPSVWMVLVGTKLASRRLSRQNVEAVRYVLVLDVLKRGVVVADPHPAHPPLCVMPSAQFLAAWQGARGPTRTAWAGLLTMARPAPQAAARGRGRRGLFGPEEDLT